MLIALGLKSHYDPTSSLIGLAHMITFNACLLSSTRCLPGYMTLWHDHFGAAHFVVALFGVAHFVAGPFRSEPFWCKFHENNFFLCFLFQFFNL